MKSHRGAPVEVDLHRLDRRFESARIVDPSSVRRLALSLQADGQREAILVVESGDRLVLVDGYRRVQALGQLGRDRALARIAEGSLNDAVLQVIREHQARSFQPIEEAWLLAGLVDEGRSQQAIATALGKDKSWVSRRLALVSALPESFQDAVRSGELSSWAANRVLLPLARANEADALLAAIRQEPLSTRALSTWFEHYQRALLELHRQDIPLREISRLLKISRNTVRRVLREETNPPQRKPTGKWQSVVSQLPELHSSARGNAVRIQELVAEELGVEIPYSTLTHLLRREQLRTPAPKRSGIYPYEPGAEMHQDTSPHRLEIGGKSLTAQCAGLILPFSRFGVVQYYPAFTRFEAKVFLNAAFGFIKGTCPRCTIDNTSVLVVAGSGPEATIAPEMQAFGEHFSVRFIPHAIGHADRKAHIERLFSFVEGNFLAARTFADWADLNAQAWHWCEAVANHKVKRELGTSPRAALEEECPFLQPLPVYSPPVYEVVHRGVDTQGYVHLDTNRYSVPERLVGKQVEVLKYFDRVVVHFQGKPVAKHVRRIGQRYAHATLEGHHGPLGRRRQRSGPSTEEQQLIGQRAVLDRYVAELKKRSPGRGVAKLKRLLNLKRTYPAAPFLAAIEQAAQYGLYDLNRLEALILKQYDLLVIDELGYLTLKAEHVNAFFKLLDQRYGRTSTLITTNLPYQEWYQLFQRKSLVDAMLDRLQHHCITIRIDGPSLRAPDTSSSS